MADPLIVRFARYYASQKHANQQYSGGLPYTHHTEDVDGVVQEFWPRWGESSLGLSWWCDNVLLPRTDEEIARTVSSGDFCHSPQDWYERVRAAAWLHDVIEDCQVDRRELEELFGPWVADLVWRVSNEPGENRKARQANTYPKTREAPLAVFLKLCDRIANVRQGGPFLQMYRREHEDFCRALRTPGYFDYMWEVLDALLRPPA